MSEELTAQNNQAVVVSISPFVVEADHPQNRDLLIQCLTTVCERRMRSSLKPSIPVIGTNGRKTMKSPTLKGQSLPELPGMRLHVSPADLEVSLSDPLFHDEDAKEELKRYNLETRGTAELPKIMDKVGPYRIDKHRMKTLCEEILLYLTNNEMKWIEGVKFDQGDCDDLPGRYIQNPGSLVETSQPYFRDQMDEFREKLLNAGMS